MRQKDEVVTMILARFLVPPIVWLPYQPLVSILFKLARVSFLANE